MKLFNLHTLHRKLRENALMFDDCFSICTSTTPAELIEMFREKAIQITMVHSFLRPRSLPELQRYCDECGIQPVNMYDWAATPGDLHLHIFTLRS